MRIGGVLLAAGEGRRFGGNKLLMRINGIPLVLLSLEALKEIERVVVVGAYAEELLPLLKDEVVIYNPKWKEGLSSSVKIGLRFFSNFDAVVFHLADMPFVRPPTVKRLIDSYDENSCYAVVPQHNGKRGNPVLISKVLFGRADELRGDEGFRTLLKEAERLGKLCKVEAGEEVLVDIDTKEDLMRFSSSGLPP